MTGRRHFPVSASTIPVDGMSAGNTYIEQYVAYNMVNAPGMAQKVKLATTDGITFK